MKIAVYSETSDACWLYRCQFPLQAMAEQGLCEFQKYTSPTLDKAFKPDIAILQKHIDPKYIELTKELQADGIKVVYECDDSYTALDPTNMANLVCCNDRETTRRHVGAYKKTGMARWFPQYKHLLEHDTEWAVNDAVSNFGRHLRLMKVADLVQVSTRQLQKEYRGWGIKSVVLPNYEKASEWVGVVKAPLIGQVIIGWAGSFSHYYTDIKPLVKPVTRILEENRNVRFKIVGIPEAMGLFSNVAKEQIEASPWESWDRYKEMVAEMDIVLAPSYASKKFAQGKSAIRVMQGWMKGNPCVASTLTYGKTVFESGGGLVADTEGEWYRHIDSLCKDSSLRRKLGSLGLSYMQTQTYEANVSKWHEAYSRLLQPQP